MQHIRPHKIASVFLFLSVVGGLLLWLTPASAQTINEVSNGLSQFFAKFFLGVASLFMQLTLFFLKMFILLAGYNGFIDAPVVKFGWNIVRDVANMFFVVVLLVIAFGTILGLEQYEWRKSMVKLVFAAIFVNFSNVICQLIIDVAQVFTITFLNAVAGTAAGNLIQMFDLQSVFELVRRGQDDISSELLIASVFALLFTIIAATSIGSYMIVMLYRMVVLWCLIIISPLAFIFSILPSTKGYADEFWKEFTNHVIAAPVMVFFLWLAFSTFGGGDVVQSHIQDKSLPGFDIGGEVNEDGTKMGVTVSAASSWDNLANFVVAVAFLFMGIERVQKLGVKGGDYIQRGMDFGKKVFTIGTGYALGRSLYDKAGGAGGILSFAANNTPIAKGIIGPDAWKRRARSTKGWATAKFNDFNQFRDKKAKQLEESSQKSSWANPMWAVKRMGAGLLESDARKEKRTHTWEEAGESAHKEWEERTGLGHTAAGKEKAVRGVKVQIAEENSAQGKIEKLAKIRMDLAKDQEIKGIGKIAAVGGAIAGALGGAVGGKIKQSGAWLGRGAKGISDKTGLTTAAKGVAGVASTIKNNVAKGVSDAVGGISQAAGVPDKKQSEYAELMQKTANAELTAGIAKGDVDMANAKRKDRALQEVLGQGPQFEAEEMAKRQEALQKGLSGLNFREATKLANRYSKTLNDAIKKGITDPSQLAIPARNLAATFTANMKLGSEQGMQALNESLAGIGWDEKTDGKKSTENDMQYMQRKVFSALTGKIQATSTDGFADFERIHGGQTDTIVKQLDGALKNAAKDGAVSLAGLLDDTTVVDGRIKYGLQENTPDGQKAFAGARNYAAGQASSLVTKLTSIDGMVVKDQASGTLTSESINQLAKALGNVTKSTRLDSRLVDSLKELRNGSPGDFARLEAKLTTSAGAATAALTAIREKLA